MLCQRLCFQGIRSPAWSSNISKQSFFPAMIKRHSLQPLTWLAELKGGHRGKSSEPDQEEIPEGKISPPFCSQMRKHMRKQGIDLLSSSQELFESGRERMYRERNLTLQLLASEKEQLFQDPRDWQVIEQTRWGSCRKTLKQRPRQISETCGYWERKMGWQDFANKHPAVQEPNQSAIVLGTLTVVSVHTQQHPISSQMSQRKL